jgi:hypothetical protein
MTTGNERGFIPRQVRKKEMREWEDNGEWREEDRKEGRKRKRKAGKILL